MRDERRRQRRAPRREQPRLEEVVQLYASYPGPGQPRRRLCGFTRVALRAGETAAARIVVPLERLLLWDVAAGRMSMPPGPVEIGAGASSADIRRTAMLPIRSGLPARRPGLVAAADFDDYANIALVDTTREAGTAVTPRSRAVGASIVRKNQRLPFHHARCSAPAVAS